MFPADVSTLLVISPKLRDSRQKNTNAHQESEDHYFVVSLFLSSRMAHALWLPDEVTLQIFQLLGLRDLASLSCVCHQWHRLSADDSTFLAFT